MVKATSVSSRFNLGFAPVDLTVRDLRGIRAALPKHRCPLDRPCLSPGVSGSKTESALRRRVATVSAKTTNGQHHRVPPGRPAAHLSTRRWQRGDAGSSDLSRFSPSQLSSINACDLAIRRIILNYNESAVSSLFVAYLASASRIFSLANIGIRSCAPFCILLRDRLRQFGDKNAVRLPP